MSQEELLNIINQNQGITQMELVKITGLNKSTISQQVKYLRKRKLVEFKPYKHINKIYTTKIQQNN